MRLRFHVISKFLISSALASVLLLGLIESMALATTFANRELGEVITESPLIVRGKTGSSFAAFGKSQPGAIYTYTDLEVTEVIKGKLNDKHITIRQPGGEKDGVAMVVPGTAHFSKAEDVVLLLGTRNEDDKSYDVPGLTTGKYEVHQDTSNPNGNLVLVNSLSGGTMYDPSKSSEHQSYTSKIDFEVFKKIAQGDLKQEQAKQTQYSEWVPKSSVPSKPIVTMPIRDIKFEKSQVTAYEDQKNITQSVKSFWVLTSLIVILIISLIIFVWYLRKNLY